MSYEDGPGYHSTLHNLSSQSLSLGLVLREVLVVFSIKLTNVAALHGFHLPDAHRQRADVETNERCRISSTAGYLLQIRRCSLQIEIQHPLNKISTKRVPKRIPNTPFKKVQNPPTDAKPLQTDLSL